MMHQTVIVKMHSQISTFVRLDKAPRWQITSVAGTLIALALTGLWRTGRLRLLFQKQRKHEASEPGLFKKHSTFESFTTPSGHVYPSIRVFYHAHPQAAKLPKDLPLLVFMHGLGGNATQFAALLTALVNVAPCLAIDLPGCGLSTFKPDEVSAYTTQAFAELLYMAIDRYRDANNNQQVVLIGHSMGCSISALLSSSTSPPRQLLSRHIVGMISICPRSNLPDAKDAALYAWVHWIPTWAFEILRLFDRWGGLQSRSITRIVGEGADDETRKLQRKFNRMSKSAVLLRMILAIGSKAANGTGEERVSTFPGKEVWSGVEVPLFLIAAEADRLASLKDVEQIAQWLTQQEDKFVPAPDDDDVGVPPDEVTPSVTIEAEATLPSTTGNPQLAQYELSKTQGVEMDAGTSAERRDFREEGRSPKHAFTLKTTLFPAPAAHGVLYSTSTVRILSGLIESFLSQHIDQRLSLGWQLRHLTTSGKWDVKNLKKWQSVDPCSAPIGDVFRAMKTLREVDDEHNPKMFVKRFSSKALPDGVAMIVDISHESPVYDPKGLEEGEVEYHKFPTVSKLPPNADEVEHFIALIDRLRQSPKLQPKDGEVVHPQIGVHCHYGKNRTGFVVICYLVERCGYTLQDAIAEFTEKPGIKHEHFVNELFVRYAVKMARRGTIVGRY